MREGQKLFSVVRAGKQLPLFPRRGRRRRRSQGLHPRAAHERVLRARLADARFFWDQDRKVGLEKRAPRLKQVLFQEKLGSYDDKAQRLKKIVAYLCDKSRRCKTAKADRRQAAALCKVDLVTDMVREFSGLQGPMGGLYAKAEGFPAPVVRAIAEHYLPVSVDDPSPASLEGAILSLADKIDSIVGVVGVGIQTTGSSDPFGLRRNAHGVCKVVLDRKLSLPFDRLVEKVLAVYGDRLKRPKGEVKAACLEFFAGRLRFILENEGIRYDFVNAALGAGLDDLYVVALRARALDALKSSPQFEPFILMAKRINNILDGQATGRSTPTYSSKKRSGSSTRRSRSSRTTSAR